MKIAILQFKWSRTSLKWTKSCQNTERFSLFIQGDNGNNFDRYQMKTHFLKVNNKLQNRCIVTTVGPAYYHRNQKPNSLYIYYMKFDRLIEYPV